MLHGAARVALGAGLYALKRTSYFMLEDVDVGFFCWKFQTRALGAVAFSGCRSDRAQAVQKEVGGWVG